MVRRLRPIAVVATAILAATTVAVMPGRAAVAGPGGHRDYGKAISHPVHDDTLPGYGGTVVDALHYDLDLAWRPKTRTLVGTEKLRFRAARSTRKAFDLDLASALTVHRARLDGHRVTVSQRHHKLVIHRRVREGTRHTLRLSYRGHPHPVWLATTRQGTMELGWMTRRSGEAWTLQEPYGAFTWYAVNDQPSDKALYDFRIVAPRHWVGVANGRMRSRKVRHQHTITRWRLATPASSYLVTVGIGPYERTVDHSIKGLPISYWTPRSQPWTRKRLRFTPKAVRWLEKRLGRYPFPTLGILVAPTGGMETQTMLTLGRDRYTLSHDVIVHELAHQWFGDEVSPRRWRDVWLNEGWAMYLAEGLWSAHGRRARLDRIFGAWNDDAAWERREEGPPAHPFKSSILDLNVYEIPPLMWDLVRRRVGTARFWRLAAAWPREHRFRSAGYDTAVAWWSARTGISPAWFHRWLLARRQPTDWTPVTGRSTGHDAPSTGSGNTPEHDSVELPM